MLQTSKTKCLAKKTKKISSSNSKRLAIATQKILKKRKNQQQPRQLIQRLPKTTRAPQLTNRVSETPIMPPRMPKMMTKSKRSKPKTSQTLPRQTRKHLNKQRKQLKRRNNLQKRQQDNLLKLVKTSIQRK